MTPLRMILCLAAGAGLLAACSKPASHQAAAASSGPDVAITEADLPRLKAGLWSTTISTSAEGARPETNTHCETGESIEPQSLGKTCSHFSLKRTFLGAIVIDATCGAGGVVSTMHMSVHGDYSSAIVGDSQVSLTVPDQPTRTFTTHTESHDAGPCPAGGDGRE